MQQTNRILGSFIGAITADCLGTPYLFMTSRKLMQQSREIAWQLSTPGIEAELAMGGMKAIAENGVNLEAILKQYHRTMSLGVLDVDLVSATCFGQKSGRIKDVRYIAQTHEFGNLCSNALCIRQLPLVYSGICWTPEVLCLQIENEATLTHVDPESIECAQLFAICLQSILQGKARLEVWDRLFAYVKHAKNHNLLISSYYSMPPCDGQNYNDIGIALQVALYHYWHNTPYITAIRSSILSGGATDINAAATGALLGAQYGIHAIPDAWQNGLRATDENKVLPWQQRFQASVQHAESIAKNHLLMKSLKSRRARRQKPSAPIQANDAA